MRTSDCAATWERLNEFITPISLPGMKDANAMSHGVVSDFSWVALGLSAGHRFFKTSRIGDR